MVKPAIGKNIKGRGSSSNREGRFEPQHSECEDDGWFQELVASPRPDTVVHVERARSIISRNDSPDIPFRQSIPTAVANTAASTAMRAPPMPI